MNKTLLPLFLLFLLLGSSAAFGQTIARYDTVTIRDIQFVPPESLAVGQDNSPLLGDTVIVEGIMATGPRDIWIGARWSAIIVDEKGGPWSGLQVVQEDTTQQGTLFSALKKGYKVRFTGRVAEFSYVTGPSHTEIFLIDKPPIPVELLGYGYRIPEPILLTCADLAPKVGEPYENCYVRIENATVINNAAPGNQMLIADATGQLIVDDWGKGLYDSLRNGRYRWPANGTMINIKGFVREDPNGLGYQLGPMSSADITILTNPPRISNVVRQPAAPTSNDDVLVSATIKDIDGTVAYANIRYKVNDGAWLLSRMTPADTIYTGKLPKQPDGSMVQYFIVSADNNGHLSMMPGDTSSSKYFYVVRDGGLTIRDLQWTPFRNGVSPYVGYKVTVTGVVTASPDDILGDYVIQNGREPWSGILVDDAANLPMRGDSVRVTGTVVEYYNYTTLSSVTAFEILSSGHYVEPLVLKTGQARDGSPEAESYEGMLLEFHNVTVTDPFPDRPNNYGEIVIDDGSGGYRVGDDFSIAYRGNLDSTFALGDKIEKIIGIGNFSFYHYKLDPRNEADIIGHTSGIKQKRMGNELTYDLSQNYPNPFNPTTTIAYRIAKKGPVELSIYNVLGQKIKTLVNEVKPAGNYQVSWDGTNQLGQLVSSGIYFYCLRSGDFIKTNKMVLLR